MIYINRYLSILTIYIYLFYIGGSVEAVVTRMSQPNSNVVFLPFDESATITGQLGRYNGGSSYDRSIYNELFNGDGSFSRVLSKFSYIIVNPRLNICLLGHANEFINIWLKSEIAKMMV